MFAALDDKMIVQALELLAPYVPVYQTMLWIALIVLGTIFFHKQCEQILDTIRRRIESGSSAPSKRVQSNLVKTWVALSMQNREI